MKKVIYSVTRVGKKENQKFSGLGYITNADLLIARVGKNSKPYIRVFEDCVKNCHPVIGKQDEYSGSHYELQQFDFKVENSFETREIEVQYNIWFKFVK